jgi:hypothetical protein
VLWQVAVITSEESAVVFFVGLHLEDGDKTLFRNVDIRLLFFYPDGG